MNKVIFASLLVLFGACTGNGEKTEKQAGADVHAASEKKYACPMQCEGDKTYAEAGKCPVCKMDLQEVAMAETDSTHKH